jgi:predicted GIY-YIG superfamily endonuclease
MMADLYYFYKGLTSRYDKRFKAKKSTNGNNFFNSGEKKQLKAIDNNFSKVQRL